MGPNGHCLGCGGEGQSWEEEGVGGTGDPGPALAMPLDATAYTRLPGVGGVGSSALKRCARGTSLLLSPRKHIPKLDSPHTLRKFEKCLKGPALANQC